jgi:cation:H+ antiporter
MTSAMAAIDGSGGIAYGNAIGSIICNTSLIAAVTIAIKPAKADRRTIVFPVCSFFAVAIFYALNAYAFNEFARWAGIILLCCFVAYMTITAVNMVKNPVEEEKDEHLECEIADEKDSGLVKDIIILLGGALVIALGAHLLVNSATEIAKSLGVSDAVIGLTVVALGTSLPELVTAITALSKGHGALSVGNILGANLFNLVFVSGIAISILPFDVPAGNTIGGVSASLAVDIPVMIAVMSIMVIPALIRNKLSRIQGLLLLAIYAGFCVFQFAL